MKPDDFRIVSRDFNPPYSDPEATRIVSVGDLTFGGDRAAIIAGPCAVESYRQTIEIARVVRAAGGDMLRGGCYKPRTSPYDFQGLGEEGLKIMAATRDETGLPVVTEVLDVRLVDTVARYADMIQVGSRSMQNFCLLSEVGKTRKPVLLKRGMAATLHEWLCAAEYIAKEGNCEIVLCERGIRTFSSGEYSRFCLDLNVVKATRNRTYLPVIVDPSHATGDADMVPAASEAAIVFGAQGLIIEVIGEETERRLIRCDAAQGIRPQVLADLIRRVRALEQVRNCQFDNTEVHAV
jgi:3-deoxy-7-phosphoheptulonate synthase